MDLEKHEQLGFTNDCCEAVKEDLSYLKNAAQEIDSTTLTGTPLYGELTKLYATYSECNDIHRQNDIIIEDRRRKI